MTSSINTGDIHDNPHFSSQEMGIFLYSSHTNFENNGALVNRHGASSPPRARSSENAQFFEDSPPLSRKIFRSFPIKLRTIGSVVPYFFPRTKGKAWQCALKPLYLHDSSCAYKHKII